MDDCAHVSIVLDLPIPPSLNGAYKNVPGLGRRATAKLKAWKAEAGWMVKLARCGSIRGPYRFTIFLPQKMRGDVDNRAKLASDLLVRMGVTSDDHKAISSHQERSASIPKGMCRIEVVSA